MLMIKRRVLLPALLLMVAAQPAASASLDWRQQVRHVPGGLLITPGSSVERADQRGRAAHTNLHMFRPLGARTEDTGPSGLYETPASLACLYWVAPHVSGCNPQTVTRVTTGGSRAIAIVDAYDYPTAAADLAAYSAQYGLPAVTPANFTVVYAAGTQPAQDPTGGWALEAALDIEMAHALAPGAQVILVEAASNSYQDLFAAEQVAAGLVTAAGGGEVSNSWSGSEYADEQLIQPQFTGKNVVFFASAGDTPGTGLPSVLPNVISVGGTTVNRDAAGNYVSQTSWANTGGGLSSYVAAPSFQQPVAAVVGARRGMPDVALVADPASGVWVYDTSPYNGGVLNWVAVGGTSVASPATAALVNNAGAFRASTAAELRVMYANIGHSWAYTDVVSGTCANAASGSASVGYDLCTGIGTPRGRAGK